MNWDAIESFFCTLWRYSTVLLSLIWSREIRTILIPWEARTLQNPSPIPSVAPVTIAQLSFSPLQYLFLRLGYGIQYLMIAQRVKSINFSRGYPKSMMKMKVLLNSNDVKKLSSFNWMVYSDMMILLIKSINLKNEWSE